MEKDVFNRRIFFTFWFTTYSSMIILLWLSLIWASITIVNALMLHDVSAYYFMGFILCTIITVGWAISPAITKHISFARKPGDEREIILTPPFDRIKPAKQIIS